MKILSLCAIALTLASVTLAADPYRVALLDFDNQTGMKPDAALGGAINPDALAQKGVALLSEDLLNSGNFALIDRRDFMAQMEKLRLTDSGKPTPVKPSFIQAAQALGADVVLRGSLQSFSAGKNVVNQGGYKTEFAKLSLRVGLEALDATDGSVLAMANGAADGQFRQTDASYTEISEDDAMNLFSKAIAQALPKLQGALDARQAKLAARPKVKLSITTTADPAMIEVDGILVGTSPLKDFEVYAGDHVLTVGKPGYRDITKRILFQKDSTVEVPMMRTELSAEEWKDILEKVRMTAIIGDPGIVVTPVVNDN